MARAGVSRSAGTPAATGLYIRSLRSWLPAFSGVIAIANGVVVEANHICCLEPWPRELLGWHLTCLLWRPEGFARPYALVYFSSLAEERPRIPLSASATQGAARFRAGPSHTRGYRALELARSSFLVDEQKAQILSLTHALPKGSL